MPVPGQLRLRLPRRQHDDAARDAGRAFEIIVRDDVLFTDHAYAARRLAAMVAVRRTAIAEEEVPVDDAPVAVPQRQASFAVAKRVAAIDVLARLARDDFDLAVAAVEQVILDQRARIQHRLVAVS